MPNIRTLIVAALIALAAPLLVATPAHAVGNYKCDTNSPQWNVDMCVRTNASRQTDGTGLVMANVRVWATGDVATLEDCPAFVAWVTIKKHDGTVLWSTLGQGACKHDDYSETFDAFSGLKVPENAYVVVNVQMKDNGDPDPDMAKISLPVVD